MILVLYKFQLLIYLVNFAGLDILEFEPVQVLVLVRGRPDRYQMSHFVCYGITMLSISVGVL